MAQGDPQRTWFAEMVEYLGKNWSPELTWPDLIELTEVLSAQLFKIKKDRNIKQPTFYCYQCKKRVESALTNISVNATILAAGRFGFCSVEEAKLLSKKWGKHRAEQNLNLYGKPNKSEKTNPDETRGTPYN
jgi:hypothetical protein